VSPRALVILNTAALALGFLVGPWGGGGVVFTGDPVVLLYLLLTMR